MRTASRSRTGTGKKKGAVQAKIRADVASYGWHVMKVFSDTNTAPPFAYTIGLETTYHHPEVVIFGLNGDLDFMHRVLNHIGARIAKGERFEHGAKKKGILPGYVCPFARFPRDAYDDHLGQAQVFHGSSRFRAVQCIWPDPKKRLPWDPRVMLPVLGRQPVFLRPDAAPKEPAWPFSEPRSRVIITSRQVATGKEPFRYVGRFRDGDWQLVCNTTSKQEDIVLATLGWAFDHDPTVRAARRLRPGQSVVRTGPRAKWKQGAVEE
jgi:Domain of unknown function (DUF4262)